MTRAAIRAWRRSGVVWPLLTFLVFASVAAAQTLAFPALTGRIVDEAGILEAGARDALTQKLAALWTSRPTTLRFWRPDSPAATSDDDNGADKKWAVQNISTGRNKKVRNSPACHSRPAKADWLEVACSCRSIFAAGCNPPA